MQNWMCPLLLETEEIILLQLDTTSKKTPICFTWGLYVFCDYRAEDSQKWWNGFENGIWSYFHHWSWALVIKTFTNLPKLIYISNRDTYQKKLLHIFFNATNKNILIIPPTITSSFFSMKRNYKLKIMLTSRAPFF